MRGYRVAKREYRNLSAAIRGCRKYNTDCREIIRLWRKFNELPRFDECLTLILSNLPK